MSDDFSNLSDISTDGYAEVSPPAQRFRDEIAAAMGRNIGSDFHTYEGNQQFKAVMNSAFSSNQADEEESVSAMGYGPGALSFSGNRAYSINSPALTIKVGIHSTRCADFKETVQLLQSCCLQLKTMKRICCQRGSPHSSFRGAEAVEAFQR